MKKYIAPATDTIDMSIYDKIGDDVLGYIRSHSPKIQRTNDHFKTENKLSRKDSTVSISSKASITKKIKQSPKIYFSLCL